MGWQFMGCCCTPADIFDFYGRVWVVNSAVTEDSEEAIDGHVLTRVASLSDLTGGSDTRLGADHKWSVDCTDFEETQSVMFTRAVDTGGKGQRVWYFLDGGYVVEVDVPFNGPPTIIDEYTVDWSTIFSAAPFSSMAFTVTQYRQSLVGDADNHTITLGTYPWSDYAIHIGQHRVTRRIPRLHLSDGSVTNLRHTWFAGGGGTITDSAYRAWIQEDFHLAAVADNNVNVGAGDKYTLTWDGGTLTDFRAELSVGDITYDDEDTTVADDIQIFDFDDLAFVESFGFPTQRRYTVTIGYARSLDSDEAGGSRVGIFWSTKGYIVTNTSTATWSGAFEHTRSSIGVFNPVDLGPVAIRLLLPDNSLWDYVAQQQDESDNWTWDGLEVPLAVRLAYAEGGGANGNYFMITSVFSGNSISASAMTLYYMSGQSVVWQKSLPNNGSPVPLDIIVSDRFVYLVNGRHSSTNCYDYDGNEYRTFIRRGGPPATHTIHEMYGDDACAVVRHSDDLSPTRELMSRYDP